MKTTLLLTFFLTFSTQVQAVLIDGNLEMFQGSLVRTTTHQSTKTFGSLGVFSNLSKSVYIGWYRIFAWIYQYLAISHAVVGVAILAFSQS